MGNKFWPLLKLLGSTAAPVTIYVYFFILIGIFVVVRLFTAAAMATERHIFTCIS